MWSYSTANTDYLLKLKYSEMQKQIYMMFFLHSINFSSLSECTAAKTYNGERRYYHFNLTTESTYYLLRNNQNAVAVNTYITSSFNT